MRLHPEARARLSVLRRMLEPLADDGDDPEPPPGLADRTIAHVADQRPHLRLPGAPPPSRRQVGEAARRGPRRIDLVVAVLALALTAGLCMSWLGRQWRDYRVLACQNNLRQFWAALQVYADGRPDAAFPRVEACAAAQLRRRVRARPRRRRRPRFRRYRVVPRSWATSPGALSPRRP